ncbi:MAG: hypothetical protein NZ891_03180 [bacterium]|nr:hypothetical protein [bacterium]MDW8163728.1 hypothetical protein [Candidatus Omnitrophota bacterium]
MNKKINRGDIICFYPAKWYQKIIAYFDGKYCHTGIYLGDDLILSMVFSGLRIENLSERYKNNEFDIYEIDISKYKKEKLISFLLSLIPIVKYDFLGLFNFLFKWITNNPRKFFCSEIIAYGLFYIGLLPERLNLSITQLINQEFICKK